MNPSQTDPKKPAPNWPTYQWHSWIWYAVMMLAMLWMWQESFRQLAVHTIAYSEFKQHLANGEVVECAIGQDDIVGKIQPKPAENHEVKKPASGNREGACQT